MHPQLEHHPSAPRPVEFRIHVRHVEPDGVADGLHLRLLRGEVDVPGHRRELDPVRERVQLPDVHRPASPPGSSPSVPAAGPRAGSGGAVGLWPAAGRFRVMPSKTDNAPARLVFAVPYRTRDALHAHSERMKVTMTALLKAFAEADRRRWNGCTSATAGGWPSASSTVSTPAAPGADGASGRSRGGGRHAGPLQLRRRRRLRAGAIRAVAGTAEQMEVLHLVAAALRPRHDVVDREVAEREVDAAARAVALLLAVEGAVSEGRVVLRDHARCNA